MSPTRTISRLLVVASLALPLASACEDQTVTQEGLPTAGGKADSLAQDAGTLSLLPAGTFQSSLRTPRYLHFGFTDSLQAGWAPAGTVEILYDQSGSSEAIEIPLSDTAAPFLSFVIESQRWGHPNHWSADQFVDLGAPAGNLVRLPISNGAGYPFASECFHIRVQNLDAQEWAAQFDGVLTDVFYGFTSASRNEYLSNNDVPWFNLKGEETAAGRIGTMREHDGGYKGSYYMVDEWVWVPDGLNLVFKLGLNRYAGSCYGDNDTQIIEHTETQTYFRDMH